MTSQQQRDELHRQIWSIANEVRGAVDGWDFFITTEAWKDACQGFTASSVAKASTDAGILESDEKSVKTARSISIPGHSKARCYIIRASALSKYQEGEAA